MSWAWWHVNPVTLHVASIYSILPFTRMENGFFFRIWYELGFHIGISTIDQLFFSGGRKQWSDGRLRVRSPGHVPAGRRLGERRQHWVPSGHGRRSKLLPKGECTPRRSPTWNTLQGRSYNAFIVQTYKRRYLCAFHRADWVRPDFKDFIHSFC